MSIDFGTAASSLHDLVVRASARSYEVEGHSAVPFWEIHGPGPLPDLVLPDLRRVEVVTDNEVGEADVERLKTLRGIGLDVWVLVPRSCLAQAHSVLGAVADRIQPWWVERDAIRFGAPRLP